MSRVQEFKRGLASIRELWDEKGYDQALAQVEEMLLVWPGNPQLHILWSSLVQLQDKPKNSMSEAKRALQTAIALDPSSPEAYVELGHFLDAVEDKPQAASKAFVEGITSARKLLIEGLIGQAKALRQLGKQKELFQCLLELLHLTHFEPAPRGSKSAEIAPDVILESPTGRVYAIQLKGPYAVQIEEILQEMRSNRSA
jgi:tetratricopeptide (TPR) repeat protein